jgi:very-short-patch-repair endonuclease
LEDQLWAELKSRSIAAERQWDLKLADVRYMLDFALFCTSGQIDVETDGDTWHAVRARIPEDNRRDNALQSAGWHVLRFNTGQIRESLNPYCIPQITETITRLGGLSDEGLVPRKFYNLPSGSAEQLALFEESAEYD